MPQETMTEQLVRQIELLRARVEDLESRKFPQLFGTWTPTVSSTTNIDSTTVDSDSGHYLIIGEMLICWGNMNIDPTAGSANTSFSIDLPITVTLSQNADGAGIFSRGDGTEVGNIKALAGTSTVQFRYESGGTGEIFVFYLFALHNQA